jgi:hypothetical protein
MDRRLAELETEARHASERYRLYRATVYGPRLSGFGRVRELEREPQRAEPAPEAESPETSGVTYDADQGTKDPTPTNVQAL